MPNEFLANVPSEGKPFVPPTENSGQPELETPPAPPAGKQESGTPPQDGVNNPDEPNLPFHKHPRWKEMHERNKTLESQLSEMQKAIDGLTKQEKKEFTQTGQLPPWFERLFGNNPEAYAIMEKEMFGSLEERILSKIQSRQEEESKAAREGEQYVASELKAMKDEGMEFEDNEFMKFLVDFKEKYGALPYDEKGRIDLRKGHDLWQQLKPADAPQTATTTERKKIADFTTKKSNPSVSKTKGEPEVMTSKTLRNVDWRSMTE